MRHEDRDGMSMGQQAGLGRVEQDGRAFVFLCGSDMDPSEVLRAHPGARFVARAQLASDGESAGAGEAVWGILIRLREEGEALAATAGVETDDGRTFVARLVGDGRPGGEPTAILAAARYWELPPVYVARLQAVLDTTDAADQDHA